MNTVMSTLKKVLVNEFPTQLVDVEDNKLYLELSSSTYMSMSEDFFKILKEFQEGADLKIKSMSNTMISVDDLYELQIEFE